MIPVQRVSSAPRGQIQIIKKGQPAPFNGVIYDTEAHALLVSKTKSFQSRLQLELDFLKRKLDIQCNQNLASLKLDFDSTKKQLQLEIESKSHIKKLLLKELETARSIPWYRHPVFVFAMGFIFSATITGLSMWGFEKIQK